MKKISVKLSNKKHTMRRKLFIYMAILSATLLIILTLSLFAIGSITSTDTKLANILRLQLEVFNRDIELYYDNISFQCTKFSESITSKTEEYLDANDLNFSDLENSTENIGRLESMYMRIVKENLLKSNCSGAFIILNTSRGKQGKNSRSCVYIKRNILGYEVKNKLLLYSGSAKEGRKQNILPHRKWNLEFDTTKYPNFFKALLNDIKPLEKSSSIDGIIELPGTSESVMLVSMPIRFHDGLTYGICGFEISSDVFKAAHAQPTTLKHLVCLFTKTNSTINTKDAFGCGISNGYYKTPKGVLNTEVFSAKNNLISLENEYNSYIGMKKQVNIYNDRNKYDIISMIPKADYIQKHIIYIIKIISIIVVIGGVLISTSLYFSRQYIVPIKMELDKIKQSNTINSNSNILEIDDLLDFLTKKDKQYELSINELLKEKEKAEKEIESIQKELDRIIDDSRKEIQPDEFEYFKQNIKTLTKTERNIFRMYLEGKTSDDIMELLNIKISTLKFHNHNIYQKLGVKSRKQLIKLAVLLEKEEGSYLK